MFGCTLLILGDSSIGQQLSCVIQGEDRNLFLEQRCKMSTSEHRMHFLRSGFNANCLHFPAFKPFALRH